MTLGAGAVDDALRALLASGTLDLPDPCSGATAVRHAALFDVARRHPVSVARLAEAHTDAVSILHEAGIEAAPGAVYGVWASEAPGTEIRLDLARGTVSGCKAFCSGLGIVDRALITGTDGTTGHLIEVTVADCATTRTDTSGWSTPALADATTGTIDFADHPIDRVVSLHPDWYLQRPGFWHGACGPAACWAGGAAGLVDAADEMADGDPHRRAHVGAMRASRWGLEAMLAQAGHEIDASRRDVIAARTRALSLRHLVERTASSILDHFGRAFGPRPYVGDAAISQRAADVHLYLRQDHAERDLAVLASPDPRAGA
jgi:hypothetical protein